MNAEEIMRQASADGREQIIFTRRSNGLFAFSAYSYRLWDRSEEDAQYFAEDGRWLLSHESGLYESLRDAILGAREIPWFRQLLEAAH